MMGKINYVTIFPECEPVHLKKDVGMLPYSLGKYCDYDYSLICYENSNFSEKEVKKYHIEAIPFKKKAIIDFARYICKNAKRIDVLNIYHITSNRNLLWIIMYKLCNPHGKIHLKLDADYRMVDMIDAKPKSLKRRIKMYILRNKVDLYTVESGVMKRVLENNWQIKMEVIPNGIHRIDDISPANIEDKENYFLTVGRLGTEQKATEYLLDAFELIKTKTTWNLMLVGYVEDSFNSYLKWYFDKNPDLKSRVIFTGNISKEKELTQLYKKAKVFVLPSKWESFALVLLEALECGDYLIVSDEVPSTNDIGRNGRYAEVVKFGDINQLADTMMKYTKKNISDAEFKDMYNWIHNNFTWKPIVERLDVCIKNLFEDKRR